MVIGKGGLLEHNRNTHSNGEGGQWCSVVIDAETLSEKRGAEKEERGENLL